MCNIYFENRIKNCYLSSYDYYYYYNNNNKNIMLYFIRS